MVLDAHDAHNAPDLLSGRMRLTDRFAGGSSCPLLSPEMQRGHHPTRQAPLPPPCPHGPAYLAYRGRWGPWGLEDNQVWPLEGVGQLHPVAVEKRVQDTRFVDTDQGGQVLSLVQLRGVGL